MQVFPIDDPYLNNNWNKNKNKLGKFLSHWQNFVVFVNVQKAVEQEGNDSQ